MEIEHKDKDLFELLCILCIVHDIIIMHLCILCIVHDMLSQS